MSQKTENLSHGVLLIGLGILAINQRWWPNLIVVIGFFFAFRNLLNKRYIRMLSCLIFYGSFYACVCYPFFMSWEFLLPISLITLGTERILGQFFSIQKKKVSKQTTSEEPSPFDHLD